MLIDRVGSRKNISFKDIQPAVMLSSTSDPIEFAVQTPGQKGSTNYSVQSFRDPEYDLFPTIGILASDQLKLAKASEASPKPPVFPGTPAAEVDEAQALEHYSAIVAMTRPGDWQGHRPAAGRLRPGFGPPQLF